MQPIQKFGTLRMFATTWAILLTFVFVRPVLLTSVSAQAAAPLTYGQAANGTLGANAHTEYTFDAKAGDKLTVIMNAIGGDIDPFLDLYDPQGRLIGEDDNSGGKDNARLSGVVIPGDGLYKLVATNKRGGSGQFSLMVDSERVQGVAFYYEGPQQKQNYQLSRPWDHTQITYRIENSLPNFKAADVNAVLAQAFQSWANVTPLTFQQVSGGKSDLDITFAAIDGALNILGETCPPSSPCAGQITFDSAEPWTLSAPTGYSNISLLGVASHEFGHAIGLLHSSDAGALMYPSYNPRNLQPTADDIRGAQQLYGSGSGRVNPAPGSTTGGGTGNTGGGTGNVNKPQVNGAITNQQYVNYWDFDVNAGETIRITMHGTSGGLDSFIVILDANNRIVAYDDDSGGNRDSSITITMPQSGTYTVAATRHQQAQGYTSGNYTLTIEYGVSANTANNNNPPPATVAPNMPNMPNSGSGVVTVSAGPASALGQQPSLDSVVNSPFEDSTTPLTQTRTATVQRGTSYSWALTWCARDANTLSKTLNDISATFAINGTPVDSRTVTRTAPHTVNGGLSCVDYSVILSNWAPGTLTLTRTLSIRNPVYDGSSVYTAGDYVDKYTVTVQ